MYITPTSLLTQMTNHPCPILPSYINTPHEVKATYSNLPNDTKQYLPRRRTHTPQMFAPVDYGNP